MALHNVVFTSNKNIRKSEGFFPRKADDFLFYMIKNMPPGGVLSFDRESFPFMLFLMFQENICR